MICDVCGKTDIKNLGAHMYQKHRDKLKPGEIVEVNSVNDLVQEITEKITEKPLSDLILEIRELLKRYHNEMSIETSEQNGKVFEIKITARIQL